MKGAKLIFITIFVLVIGIIGCSQAPTSSIESVDKPALSSQEAISIAKREAITNDSWTVWKDMATSWASRSEGWTAKYKGNGVWEVKFRLVDHVEGWVYIYLWRVYESNGTAKYIARDLYQTH